MRLLCIMERSFGSVQRDCYELQQQVSKIFSAEGLFVTNLFLICLDVCFNTFSLRTPCATLLLTPRIFRLACSNQLTQLSSSFSQSILISHLSHSLESNLISTHGPSSSSLDFCYRMMKEYSYGNLFVSMSVSCERDMRSQGSFCSMDATINIRSSSSYMAYRSLKHISTSISFSSNLVNRAAQSTHSPSTYISDFSMSMVSLMVSLMVSIMVSLMVPLILCFPASIQGEQSVSESGSQGSTPTELGSTNSTLSSKYILLQSKTPQLMPLREREANACTMDITILHNSLTVNDYSFGVLLFIQSLKECLECLYTAWRVPFGVNQQWRRGRN